MKRKSPQVKVPVSKLILIGAAVIAAGCGLLFFSMRIHAKFAAERASVAGTTANAEQELEGGARQTAPFFSGKGLVMAPRRHDDTQSAPAQTPTVPPSPPERPPKKPIGPPFFPDASQNPVSEPAKQPFDEATPQPVWEPANKPVDSPQKQPVQKPVKPAEKPADKPIERTAQKPADSSQKPADKPIERTAQKPADKPQKQPIQKPADKPTQKPAKPAEKPVSKPREQPAQKPSAKPERPSSAPAAAKPSTAQAPNTPQKNGKLIFVFDDAGSSVRQAAPFFRLPFPVTIAVLPGLPQSKATATAVRSAKKELFLHQPMQAVDRSIDPGPGSIQPEMSTGDVARIVRKNIVEIGPIAGMNNHEGSLITADRNLIGAVLDVCIDTKIIFLDSRTSSKTQAPAAAMERGMHIWERDIFLDNTPVKADMLEMVNKGLEIADKKGYAIMIGHVQTPALAELLNEIYRDLQKQGYVFTTLSRMKK